jgi:hypothetical protein
VDHSGGLSKTSFANDAIARVTVNPLAAAGIALQLTVVSIGNGLLFDASFHRVTGSDRFEKHLPIRSSRTAG